MLCIFWLFLTFYFECLCLLYEFYVTWLRMSVLIFLLSDGQVYIYNDSYYVNFSERIYFFKKTQT